MLQSPPRPRTLRIGSLELRSPVLIAPMVGITDAPCRRLTHELGAGLVSTEMIAAEAVVRSTDAALALLDLEPGVDPVAAQLVGCDPAMMADAAQVCVAKGAAVVDVNLGCPVPRVVSRGSGAALARDISTTARVLAAIVRAVPVPVTAKMRLGWDHGSINAPELSRALQDAGVSAVAVHGRTRCQRYQGSSDWAAIAQVNEAVTIPVIGSGDVDDAGRIAQRIADGVVDGVVVARAMLGNQWFVRQAVARAATGEIVPDQTFSQRMALTWRHLDLLCAHYGERRALRIGRKYVAWAIKGCAGAARLRALVQTLDTRAQLDELFTCAARNGPAASGWFRPVFTSGDG